MESNTRRSERSNEVAVDLRRTRRAGLGAAPAATTITLAGILLVIAVLAGCSSTVVDKLEAARRGDPEDMREAITEMGDKLYAMERSAIPYDDGARSAVEYLKEITEQKVDPLNRAQALKALGRLQRPDVGQLYVRSLSDPFWLVRLEAAKAIYRNHHPDAAQPLISQLEAERFVEVRIELLRALIAVGTDECLKTVLEILLDRTGRYSAMKLKAYDGVVEMSGRTYALKDIESWEAFYAERFPAAQSIPPVGPPDTPSDPSGA